MALQYKAVVKMMLERMTELDGKTGTYEVQEHEILDNIVDEVHKLAGIQARVELRKDEIDINTILTADVPCRMKDLDGDKDVDALTVDRNYAIQYIDEAKDGRWVVIIDDAAQEHHFPIDRLETWFSWTLMQWKYATREKVSNKDLE